MLGMPIIRLPFGIQMCYGIQASTKQVYSDCWHFKYVTLRTHSALAYSILSSLFYYVLLLVVII